MDRRPRIGITMRIEIETRRFYLGRDYSEAVEAAGGVPVHIALIPKSDFADTVVADLDGVLLPGSDTDVDPAYFGEEPHPSLKKVVPEKDETDRMVISAADKAGLPILAICYGMQALNVARGGTLIQDIGSQVDGCIKHDQGVPLVRPSHSITIEPRSRLAAMKPQNSDEILRVNSHHHQAVANLGRDLQATAWAKDGVIECIEDIRPERFVLGVQWHPELSWSTDPFSREIFGVFVEECNENRLARVNVSDDVKLSSLELAGYAE